MPLPFDATLKDIVQTYPHDFETALRLTGPQPAAVLNVDLSTISAATDIALGYGDPPVAITDLNFQSARDPDLADRVLLYHALLRHRFHVPVHSVVVLLRPAADDTTLTGRLRYQGQPRRGKMEFRFEVVRLWQQPVRRFLRGGLGTLPLATLCQLPEGVSPEEGLAGVIRQIIERVEQEMPSEQGRKLLTAAFVLTGMRIPRDVALQLFQGVRVMHESDTYQMILEEGETRGLHRTLLSLGRKRFGEPSQAAQDTLLGITNIERLRRLSERLLDVTTWQELLDTL